VLRAAWAQGDFGYLLEWVATRLPSLRHREELKSGALSLLFDRWPALAHRWRAIVADASPDSLFRWRHAERAERNRRLAQDLLLQRGWRLFEEMRLPEGRLDHRVAYDRPPFYFPPFAAAPREEGALVRLLELCDEHSIPVLVLPAAQPRALTAALDRDGGRERLDAFARRVFGARAAVAAPLGLRMPWPHRFFADLAHVNEDGLERYTREILVPLGEAAARAQRRPGSALAPAGRPDGPPVSSARHARKRAGLRRLPRSSRGSRGGGVEPAALLRGAIGR
jgi:hypothetical protein